MSVYKFLGVGGFIVRQRNVRPAASRQSPSRQAEIVTDDIALKSECANAGLSIYQFIFVESQFWKSLFEKFSCLKECFSYCNQLKSFIFLKLNVSCNFQLKVMPWRMDMLQSLIFLAQYQKKSRNADAPSARVNLRIVFLCTYRYASLMFFFFFVSNIINWKY